MKKNNAWQKTLSLTLATMLCLSPLATMAEGLDVSDMTGVQEFDNSQVVEVETTTGNREIVDVLFSFEEILNPNGSRDLSISAKANNTVLEDGTIVNYNGSADLTTDENGKVIDGTAKSNYSVFNIFNRFFAFGGEEKRVETSAPELEADIPLKEGEKNTVTGDPVGPGTPDGDVPTSDEDGEYDYTQQTIIQQGSVTVENIGVSTDIINEGESDIHYKNDLDYTENPTTPDDSNDLYYYNGQAPDTENLPEGDPDFDFTIAGDGVVSLIRPAYVYTEEMTDEEMSEPKVSHTYVYMTPAYLAKYLEYNPNFDTSNIKRNEDGSYATVQEQIGVKADGTPKYRTYLVNNDGTKVRTEDMPVLDKEGKQVYGPDGQPLYLGRSDIIGNGHFVEGWYQESYTDEEGNFHEGEWIDPLNGKKYAAVWAGAQQFVLVDKETGEVITTYCADAETRTQEFYGYNIENLEDADYYDAEQAAHIRTIAHNGYWGTEGTEVDLEGNVVPKAGSLEAMKEMMRNAVDEEGNRIFSDEEIDNSLTDGVALSATQMAIWSYSNKMDGVTFVNAHYGTDLFDVPTEKEDEVELTFKLYDYLKNMEPSAPTPDSTNTVITAENALKDMSVTVLGKDENHENNKDLDNDNDAYSTNVTFALVVTPDPVNDDMIVRVVNGNGEVLKEARIAGTTKEGETFLDHDGYGNYTIEDVTMIEGNQEIKIDLQGVQNLTEGVYLFSSEIRNEDGEEVSSQTMVGRAEGKHAVNVTMTYAFNLSVNDEVSLFERFFRDEWTNELPDTTPNPVLPQPTPTPSTEPTPTPSTEPTPTPSTEPTPTPTDAPSNPPSSNPPASNPPASNPPANPPANNPTPAPQENNPQPGVLTISIEANEIEILDEAVPLAAAPETGDESIIYTAFALMSAAGLVYMALTRKREKA